MTATLTGSTSASSDAPAGRTSRQRASVAALGRGRPDDGAWVRPTLLLLLGATGVLYLWDLGASGWSNSFYSAAVQAGSQSWEAFFYGSSDAANSITVDKTPAALWVMELSVRAFGLSSWSILVPEALMGVATVGVLYLAVRRAFSPAAGLLAGAVLALTPVAALMFRFNNPDALLTLLLVGSAYCTLRAVERASTRWIVLAATLVGFGFLTKMLQSLLVVPVLVLVYLLCAPTTLRRRVVQLGWAALALLVSAGWWVAIVELVPAQYRPYIGGSQNNSILELTLGYNGLGRLNGDETGSVGGGNGWGTPGLGRLFGADIGGQIGWLLPAALILLVAGVWATGRVPRTDVRRAAFAVWGGWLLVTGLTFSLMQGIFHAYYTVALAPAVAAVVGMGAVTLWNRRSSPAASAVLAIALGLTTVWSYVLLGRGDTWHPWLRVAVLVVGLLATAATVAVSWLPRAVVPAVAAAAVVASLLGPLGWTLNTVATPHTGAIPTAGPAVAGGGFGPGAMRGGVPGGGRNGLPQPPPGAAAGQLPQGFPGFAGGQGRGARPGGGGMGGLLGSSTPSAQVVQLLSQDASSYRWAAAAVGSNTAAGYQLGTELPVMAVGGFNGSDPSPTLAQFQQYVADGDIHWFVAGGGLGGGFGGQQGGSSSSSAISSWVQENFTARTVDGVTLYDLSSQATGATTGAAGGAATV